MCNLWRLLFARQWWWKWHGIYSSVDSLRYFQLFGKLIHVPRTFKTNEVSLWDRWIWSFVFSKPFSNDGGGKYILHHVVKVCHDFFPYSGKYYVSVCIFSNENWFGSNLWMKKIFNLLVVNLNKWTFYLNAQNVKTVILVKYQFVLGCMYGTGASLYMNCVNWVYYVWIDSHSTEISPLVISERTNYPITTHKISRTFKKICIHENSH